jgi:hypothetical protein
MDRVMIRENQKWGQRIWEYELAVLVSAPSGEDAGDASSGELEWQPWSNGTSVGNKRIDLGTNASIPYLMGAAVDAWAVRLTVASTAAFLEPLLHTFAAYAPCSSG